MAGLRSGRVISKNCLQAPCPVHLSRLVERARDGLEAGQDDQRHEGRRLPDDRQADRGKGPIGGVEPDHALEAETAQHVVHDAVFGMEEPREDQARKCESGRAHGIRSERRTGHFVLNGRLAIRASAMPTSSAPGTVMSGDEHRVPGRLPEHRILQHEDVVLKPGEGRRRAGGQRQVLKAGPDQTADRIDDDERQQQGRGQEKQHGQGALARIEEPRPPLRAALVMRRH